MSILCRCINYLFENCDVQLPHDSDSGEASPPAECGYIILLVFLISPQLTLLSGSLWVIYQKVRKLSCTLVSSIIRSFPPTSIDGSCHRRLTMAKLATESLPPDQILAFENIFFRSLICLKLYIWRVRLKSSSRIQKHPTKLGIA